MFTNVSNQRNVCDQLTCSEFENRVSEKDQQEQEQSWIFSRRIGLLIKTATEVLTTRVKDRDRDTEAKAQGQSWNDGKGISLLSPWSLQPALHPPWIQTRLIRSIRLSVQVTVQVEEGCWGRESVKLAGLWEKFKHLGK